MHAEAGRFVYISGSWFFLIKVNLILF